MPSPFLPALLLAAAPGLGLAGKPQLGAELRFELTGAGAGPAFLLVDGTPGPARILGLTLGVGLSPALQIHPMGVPAGGARTLVLPVPNDPNLAGGVFFAEAVTTLPLASTGALTVTLAAPQAIVQVNDYTYQLQGRKGADLDLGPIAASAFDLCIVDFSRDGTDEFTPAEVAGLRGPAEPNRLRLAYLSIGEAEDYRWYWNLISPSLIAASNPNWPGNYKALYWEPEWKQVILTGNAAVGKSYLDRIIDQGFDGVYLDIVDAFEFFGPSEAGGQNWKRDAAREMVDFIVELAHHARITRGRSNFLVVPQNGANIFEAEWYPTDTLRPQDPATPQAMADAMRDRLLATVDAIGVEDVFYYGSKNQNNAYNPQNYLLQILATWRQHGLPVLSTEYLTRSGKIDAFYDQHAPAQGFVPYATRRKLDRMTINPGHEPD